MRIWPSSALVQWRDVCCNISSISVIIVIASSSTGAKHNHQQRQQRRRQRRRNNSTDQCSVAARLVAMLPLQLRNAERDLPNCGAAVVKIK